MAAIATAEIDALKGEFDALMHFSNPEFMVEADIDPCWFSSGVALRLAPGPGEDAGAIEEEIDTAVAEAVLVVARRHGWTPDLSR